jgi:hypothetical protein
MGADSEAASAARNAVDQASKLTKKLPTFRVGFTKQIDALRAYALLSGNGTAAVRYSKVAETIGIHESNVSSMNPFFVENGFIEKSGNGYMPTPAVLEFNRAHAWNPATASQKLAPVIRQTWFARALIQKLAFRPMSEDDAIEVLAAECNGGPDAKGQIKVLIDYLDAGALLKRENGQLAALKASDDGEPASKTASQLPTPPTSEPAPPVSTQPFAAQSGAISFQISVNVSMAELAGWAPDRITAFFAGVAQAMAAQKNGTS